MNDMINFTVESNTADFNFEEFKIKYPNYKLLCPKITPVKFTSKGFYFFEVWLITFQISRNGIEDGGGINGEDLHKNVDILIRLNTKFIDDEIVAKEIVDNLTKIFNMEEHCLKILFSAFTVRHNFEFNIKIEI